jgi:hypothetical protein
MYLFRGSSRGTRGRGRGWSRRDINSMVSYKGRQGDGDSWNKVKLLNASRHERTDVLRALVSAYQELQPLSFQKQGMNYVFYVETRAQVSNSTFVTSTHQQVIRVPTKIFTEFTISNVTHNFRQMLSMHWITR